MSLRAVFVQTVTRLVLVLGTLWGGTLPSSFAQPTQLLTLTNVWHYNQSGGDLGTDWREFDFDDSSWSMGPGVLSSDTDFPGGPELTHTALTRVGTNGTYIITDYFRTAFNLDEVKAGFVLTASALVDDGAVFYLNGVELFRQNMPSGPVTSSTLAANTIAVSQEGIFVETTAPATALRVGRNVLAVEVHQPYLTSSDVTFGLSLLYGALAPLLITREPADLTVAENQSAALSVAVAGSSPQFQWHKDDLPLNNATGSSLVLPFVSRETAAQYYVVISNAQISVTSRVATVTVVLDTNGPTLLAASGTAGFPFVNVHFSEALDFATATDVSHYSVTRADGTDLHISSADYSANGFGDPRVVTLNVDLLEAGLNYYATVSAVRDLQGNLIQPNSRAGVAINGVELIPLNSIWKYDDSGRDLGNEWHEPTFEDSGWASGPALLYNDVNFSPQTPGVARTEIAATNAAGDPIVTHYFRHHFTNNVSPLGASIMLHFFADDGLVAYLNGIELYRAAMPAGPIDYTTRAVSGLTEGAYTNSMPLSGAQLVFGENVLAVEVHQRSLMSPVLPDISFGLAAEANTAIHINQAPIILDDPEDQTVGELRPVEFSAQVLGAETMQWYRGQMPVLGATSTTLRIPKVELADDGAEFSLVVSNALGVTSSRRTKLHVLPDSMAPFVRSASMGTNIDHVLVTFSEVVDPLSANDPGSYSITNSTGETLLVLSAAVTNGTNVLLVTQPRMGAEPLYLTVAGVQDVSTAKNVVAGHNAVTIDYEVVLLSFDSVWYYDESGNDLGTTWREPAYNEDAWPQGPGLLGFEDAPIAEPIRTLLAPPEFRGPTYYFRRCFEMPARAPGVRYRLRHFIDDGIVLFLNGIEVHRLRVPYGQTASTLATIAATDATLEGPFDISSSAFLPGENLFAAEVHQVTPTSADVVFGLQLVQAIPSVELDPFAPSLRIGRAGNQLMITWDEPGFVLETSASLNGPWQPAPHPTLPYVVTADAPAAFFRLREEVR